MRYLFHSSLSLSTPSRAIMYDEALSLAQQGAEIILLYCGGAMSQCTINICGNKKICSLCKSHYRGDQRHLQKSIRFIPFTELISKEESQAIHNLSFTYNNITQIQSLTYRGINIGYGVVSAFISQSRNLAPLIDNQARIFFDASLRNAALSIAAGLSAITRFKPESIYLYNGRFADSRPMIEIAQLHNLPYITLEAVYGINKNFRARYENSSPFSMQHSKDLILHFWNDNSISEREKQQIGKSFFTRRRNAQYSGDKIYVATQQQGLLPNNWDESKHNIVIFNSSEDEFAAIGGDYEKKALFESQLVGLQYIQQSLKKYNNIHITLRIHPNLSHITYSYVKDLYSLQSDQFDVIPGDSPISTYALLDAADTVVVFGSTMGAESVFWGKPTILLAGALYYYLGICYLPHTRQELIDLLIKPLAPKDPLGALQYGYFLMNEKWESPKVLDFGWELWTVHIFGRTFRLELNNWKKFLGSRKVYAILLGVRRVAVRIWNKFQPNHGCRYVLPRKEVSM